MYEQIFFIITVVWLAIFAAFCWKFYWEERDAARERARRDRKRR